MGYTRKECERLVMSADRDGKITFFQIRRAFPDCDSSFFYDMIGDQLQMPALPEFNQPFRDAPIAHAPRSADCPIMLFWKHCPSDYMDGYEFKDSDTFYLSILGENLRYDYIERQKDRALAWWAVVSGSLAAITSVIALLR